jgi:hypothetical protein
MSRIFANWKAQPLGCRVNRRCGERRLRSDRASLCAPRLRSDCFRDSPSDPGTVDQDRRRRGHEADQKSSCVLHAQPPCDGLQVLAGSSPARPAAFAVGGSVREHQGGAALCSSSMIKIDNCLTRRRQRGIGSRERGEEIGASIQSHKNNNPALVGGVSLGREVVSLAYPLPHRAANWSSNRKRQPA